MVGHSTARYGLEGNLVVREKTAASSSFDTKVTRHSLKHRHTHRTQTAVTPLPSTFHTLPSLTLALIVSHSLTHTLALAGPDLLIETIDLAVAAFECSFATLTYRGR